MKWIKCSLSNPKDDNKRAKSILILDDIRYETVVEYANGMRISTVKKTRIKE